MKKCLQKIYLVRHGATDWTATGQHTGLTDIPLSQSGESEVRKLRTKLSRHAFTKVLTSPLRRVSQTAELAGFGEGAVPERNLLEWNYGNFEGKSTIEIQVNHPEWNLFTDGCPDGEAIGTVSARADFVIRRIRKIEGDVLIFSHGSYLRILAVRWLGLCAKEARHLYLATASLSILGYDHTLNEPVIYLWNDTSDLSKGE